jgi:hypothetical protein
MSLGVVAADVGRESGSTSSTVTESARARTRAAAPRARSSRTPADLRGQPPDVPGRRGWVRDAGAKKLADPPTLTRLHGPSDEQHSGPSCPTCSKGDLDRLKNRRFATLACMMVLFGAVSVSHDATARISTPCEDKCDKEYERNTMKCNEAPPENRRACHQEAHAIYTRCLRDCAKK